MAKIDVFDMTGAKAGTMTLSDEVFGAEYNESLIHQVVKAYLANQRQGTKSTLTRSEVRGHAKKPWRQKGTGRARHGSTKGPQWRGGGVVFAPKPRDFSQKINKQMKRGAFISAISTKLAQNDIVVVNELKLEAPKTKEMKKIALVVLKGSDENIIRASGNIPKVNVCDSELLNVYQIVATNKLILTQEAIKSIEEAYKA
jgi:large subunit ribosomal protein L4